ncbi:MAG: S41 family peptidase [Eubacteriales bacterium]|nr:S41 family peptidase [Eubacteriales bacterium]MDD4104992.1 S41 family peptidase [Eubacteriales bacterium]MDD4711683.1 S41 family peptidase [Eubacteriales bacterium]NLO15737.1 S41 family peptidase [Clostridiales bacterium]
MFKKTLIISVVLMMLLSGAQAASASNIFGPNDTVTISRSEYESLKKYALVEEVRQYVETYYYKEPEEKAMLEGAIQGLLSGLGDAYTFYYPAEAWETMWEDDEGKYAGIGVQMLGDWRDSSVTIVRVFRGTPAEEAGLKKGDIFYKVEELEVSTATMQDAVNLMRGVPGETVHVEVVRNGEVLPFDIVKADITVNRVESGMLDNDVGYIAVYEFAGDVAEAFENALTDLTAKGAKGIVIDLRDNPGGWVQAGVDMADLFLDENVLFYTEDRAKTQEKTYTKNGKTDIPLVLVLNENSASTSEIFAAALKDYERATIVGTTTFGKGVIQYVIGLSDGVSGFQFTSAQYFSPNGNQVHEVGVEPHVESLIPEDMQNTYFQFGDLSDPQLETAYEEMLKIISPSGTARR